VAYDSGVVDLHEKIIMRDEVGDKNPDTIGRVILREVVPDRYSFSVINKVMKKKELANLID